MLVKQIKRLLRAEAIDGNSTVVW